MKKATSKFILIALTVLCSVACETASANSTPGTPVSCYGQSDNFFSESAQMTLTGKVVSNVLLTDIELSISDTNGGQPIRAASAVGDTKRHPTTTVFTSPQLTSSGGTDNCNFTIEFSKTAQPPRGKINARCDQTYSALYFKCK